MTSLKHALEMENYLHERIEKIKYVEPEEGGIPYEVQNLLKRVSNEEDLHALSKLLQRLGYGNPHPNLAYYRVEYTSTSYPEEESLRRAAVIFSEVFDDLDEFYHRTFASDLFRLNPHFRTFDLHFPLDKNKIETLDQRYVNESGTGCRMQFFRMRHRGCPLCIET
ncbi:MAG: hypothetical protein GF334_03840 [Candidatus Altiarchaeales archaeon]|nr:hypothetical protein [Candidatus Altiarchaeales archaeon]